MACGMIAMQLAGVDVESYDAYEIDKYAVKTAQHNFPMIKEHGDVFNADFTQYEGVDFLVGGSPCTYWSIAQTKNRETVASGMGWELFSQYVRALREAKPKYFIYENNKSMSKQIRASIDDAFGFEAVLINSALVSAQNRQRLYWVGKRNADGTYSKVNVEQPEDRGILLKDVLDSAVARDLTCNDKSYTLTASYDGACAWNTLERHQRNMVAEPINVTADGKSQTLKAQYAKNNADNFCCYTSTYGASGVAEPVPLTEREMDYMVRDHQERRWNFCNRPGEKDKSECITANIHKGVPYNVCAEPVCVAERGRMYCGQPQHYEARDDGKTNTLTSVEKDNRVAEPITGICQVGAMPMPNGELSTSAGFRIYSTEAKGRYLCANGGGAGAKTGLYAIPYTIEFDDDGKPIKAINADGSGAGAKTGLYAEPVCLRYERTEEAKRCRKAYEAHEIKHGYNELNELHPRPDGKTNTLTTVQKDNMVAEPIDDARLSLLTAGKKAIPYPPCIVEFDENGKPIKAIGLGGKEITIYEVRDGKITIKGKQYPIKLRDGYYIIRKLTVSECKRLQTVPEWYDFSCVSNSQAYKMLGNGWTCEVIAHLIKACLEPSEHTEETECGEQYCLF